MGRTFRRNSLWQNGLKMACFDTSIASLPAFNSTAGATQGPGFSLSQGGVGLSTGWYENGGQKFYTDGNSMWSGNPPAGTTLTSLQNGDYRVGGNILKLNGGNFESLPLSTVPQDITTVTNAATGTAKVSADGRTFISDGSGKWHLASFDEVAKSLSKPGSTTISDLMKDTEVMDRAAKNGITADKIEKTLDIESKLADVRTKNSNADVAELQTTKFWMDFGMSAFKGIAELTTNILQYKLAQQKMDNDSRLIDLKETIAEYSNTLQRLLMDKEYAFKDAALKNQKEIAELSYGAEIQKARISADVRKAGDRNRSMAQIFARRNYGYGQPRYA